MAAKRKVENNEFLWTDDEVQLLLEVTSDYKSQCEFQGENWETKRSKYGNICDRLLVQYPSDAEKYPNKDNVTKERIAAKIKTIRTSYRKLSIPIEEVVVGE